jgi:hypothetical protein
VGTRKLIEPQLKGIGLPVEYVTAPGQLLTTP